LRKGKELNRQRPWDGMAIRRSGGSVKIRTVEERHQLCVNGQLNDYTVQGRFSDLTDFDGRAHLLTKGSELRRYADGPQFAQNKSQWQRTTASRYLKKMKIKHVWGACPPSPNRHPSNASTIFLKPGGYPGYSAIRFSDKGRKVQAVWQGDGPGFCFVGRLARNGTYAGTQYTFGGDQKRTSLRTDELMDGKRISPPAWFKKSAPRAFARGQCR
jgi:hypothetical protein